MKIRFLVLAIVVIAAAACSAAGVSPPAAAPTASATPTATATAAPASAPPLATPGPQPPNALLIVNGGAPSVGELGTYTWREAGSEAPWLPGTRTKVAPGGAASVSLEVPVPTAAWWVKLSKPGGTDIGARQIAAGTGAITFTVPAQAGTIALHVEFASDAGDALYFWALSPG
jgi:hypothetical protein